MENRCPLSFIGFFPFPTPTRDRYAPAKSDCDRKVVVTQHRHISFVSSQFTTDIMREILYLQAGNYSNYVGTHFWNTQDMYRSLDEGNQVDDSISFTERQNSDVPSSLDPPRQRISVVDVSYRGLQHSTPGLSFLT